MKNGQYRETGGKKGTQDEDKTTKHTTQYVLYTIMRKQTQITFKFVRSEDCIF
jgi:hypothetical protein